MSERNFVKPIVNILGRKSIIGSPINDDILVFDESKNAFVYRQKSEVTGIQSINNSFQPNQGFIGASPIFISTNISLGLTSIGIVNQGITSALLADQSVTVLKLGNQAVTTVKIEDEAVSTDKLKDDSVTTDKIDDNAVTNDKITDMDPEKLNQDNATVGQVLKWTANNKWEPEDP